MDSMTVKFQKLHEQAKIPQRSTEGSAGMDLCARIDEPVTVPASPFAVVEGCYAMHPALRGYFAGAVFLTHSKEAQRRRILARSG